jgi:hypothetical protein
MDSCDPEVDCIGMIWDCLDNGDYNWSDTTDNSELYQDLSEDDSELPLNSLNSYLLQRIKHQVLAHVKKNIAVVVGL